MKCALTANGIAPPAALKHERCERVGGGRGGVVGGWGLEEEEGFIHWLLVHRCCMAGLPVPEVSTIHGQYWIPVRPIYTQLLCLPALLHQRLFTWLFLQTKQGKTGSLLWTGLFYFHIELTFNVVWDYMICTFSSKLNIEVFDMLWIMYFGIVRGNSYPSGIAEQTFNIRIKLFHQSFAIDF